MSRNIINRIGLAAIAGCVAVGALAFAGCGGGSSTDTTGASGASGASGSTALSQDEFVSQMNSICKDTNAKVEAVAAPASNQLSDVAATIQDEQPIYTAALSQVDAINPPSDLESKFNTFVSAVKAQQVLQGQFLDAAKANDVNQANAIIAKAKKLSAKSDAAAKSMGLTECAHNVSPQG